MDITFLAKYVHIDNVSLRQIIIGIIEPSGGTFQTRAITLALSLALIWPLLQLILILPFHQIVRWACCTSSLSRGGMLHTWQDPRGGISSSLGTPS